MSRDSHSLLSKRLASDGKQGHEGDGNDYHVVPDSLIEFSAALAAESEPSAPIKLPDPRNLTVYLADINLLHHLDEIRSDMNIWQGAFWTFLGWIAGYFTNVFTSSQNIDKSGWVFLALLCSIVTLTGFMTVRASRRATTLRNKIQSEAIEGKVRQ